MRSGIRMVRSLAVLIVLSMLFVGCTKKSENALQKNKEVESIEFTTIRTTIDDGGAFAIAVCEDGTVVASGDNSNGQCDVSTWENIVEVAAGSSHAVGLRADGTVVATGDNSHGQCEVEEWEDIVSIAANTAQTVGLREDGTLVSTTIVDTGKSVEYARGQDDVSEVRDAVAVAVGDKHIAVLKSDGTVEALGGNFYKQCETGDWEDIVQITAGEYYTMGLKKDGTIVATPKAGSFEEDNAVLKVDTWNEVKAVFPGSFNTYAICEDGTILATESEGSYSPNHEKEVVQLENVEYICDGHYFTLVLHKNGEVTLVGNAIVTDRKIDVSQWNSIRSPFDS